MALQYFIYPYFIPYFPFFSTVPIFSFSALNSSLDDIDIRYNATSGKPEWRERGAGSFVPFESGKVKAMILWKEDFTYGRPSNMIILNRDGTFYSGTTDMTKINEFSDTFTAELINYGGYYGMKMSSKVDGYYTMSCWSSASYWPTPAFYNANNVLSSGIAQAYNNGTGGVIYFGDDDPAQ